MERACCGSIDCSIPDNPSIVTAYQKAHPALSIEDCEYLLYGSVFYQSLIDHQGIVLHASCVCYEGEAYLFSGPSGIGKSTLATLWTQHYPHSLVVNDDKPALVVDEQEIMAYGTPFSGKTDKNLNMKCPVKAIVFLERGKKDDMRLLEAKRAIPLIFSETMLPKTEDKLDKMVKTVERIQRMVPIYQMRFVNNTDAAVTVHETVNSLR